MTALLKGGIQIGSKEKMNTSQQQKIFFDISGILLHLHHADTYTGIQRVVASVLAELVDRQNIYICWGRRGRRSYTCAKLDSLLRDDLLDPLRLKAAFQLSEKKRALFPPLRHYEKNKLKYHFHCTKLWIANLIGSEREFVRLGTSSEKWRSWQKRRARGSSLISGDFFDVVKPGDCVITLDAIWGLKGLGKHFKKAKDSGIEIKVVVYDLVPLIMPDVAVPQLPRVFYDWLYESLDFASEYVAISRSAASDLKGFLTSHNSTHRVTVVPLAQARLSLPEKKVNTEVSWLKSDIYSLLKGVEGLDDVTRSIAGSRYVLSVGTIEARKNHWRLLHAWDILIKTLPHERVPRLVIAGRRGWMIHDFERFLKASGHLNGFVTVINAPSDDELDFLYRNCLFTVMPSLYEGWGLPVGESLSYGRTAVVANNSSLPEVGGVLVRYCDATSVTSIVEACRDLITDADLVKKLEAEIAGADLRTWGDVAKDFVDIAKSDLTRH